MSMARSMLPVVALVGRPNVGKSTLFNRLTRTRNALVADFPGLTRDRQYGVGKIGSRAYLAMDSGGLTGESAGLEGFMVRQVWQALDEADAVLFLVDGRTGLTPADQDIAQQLRRLQVPLFLVVNKTEHMDLPGVSAEFHDLALGQPYPISAAHDHGVRPLLEEVLGSLPQDEPAEGDGDAGDAGIRLAVVGRPNVGKSTLVNRLLGEQRMLTCDMPGTTRDSVAVPFERDGQRYTLIDTAGVRRRSRIVEVIEKFSVLKTLQAIEQAHVAVLMLDARQGIAEQDTTLLGHILESGRALVVAVNKWDHLSPEVRDNLRRELDRKLVFLDFAKFHFISALHGSGVMDVLASVRRAYACATRKLATPELTRILADAVVSHQPPMVRGHRIKLRYAHQGGQNPPLLIIHGNRVEHVPEAYRRYLANIYRKALRLEGTPVRIEFKGGDNPYAAARPGHPSGARAARPAPGAGRGKARKR